MLVGLLNISNVHITLQGRDFYYHFTDEETEAQVWQNLQFSLKIRTHLKVTLPTRRAKAQEEMPSKEHRYFKIVLGSGYHETNQQGRSFH